MSAAAHQHPEAAPIRLRQICLLTRDLYAVADDLVAALGIAVCHGKADLTRYGVPYEPPAAHSAAFFAKHGLVNALLPAGDSFIELVMPTRPDTPAGRFLDRRGGDCGYMFIVEVGELDSYRSRAGHSNFRVAGGADYPQYQDLHLDPRDTGGTMLAFSLQREGVAFDGGWYPAGPHWREARRASVTGMSGAEIACRDPSGVAARWSRAIGRPAEPERDGRIRIRLDGSDAVFVPSLPGAPDSLSVVDLRVSNVPSRLTAASRRGLPTREDAVQIGGVWFRLS